MATLPWVRLSSIVGVYWSDYSKSPDTGLHSRVAFAPPIASHRCVFGGAYGKSTSMKRSSYRHRDYAFGQTILTLRTMLGLTQTVSSPSRSFRSGCKRSNIGQCRVEGDL